MGLMVEPPVIALVLGLLGYRAFRFALVWPLVTLATYIAIVVPAIALLWLVTAGGGAPPAALVAAVIIGAELLIVWAETIALGRLCQTPWFQRRARGTPSRRTLLALSLVVNVGSFAAPLVFLMV